MAAVIRERLRSLRAAYGFTPTRRLAGVCAGSAIVWLASGSTVGFAIAASAAGLILGFVVVDVAALPRRDDLDVSRAFPGTIGVGDRVPVTYTVRSLWPRTLFVQLFDALPAKFLSRTRDDREEVLPSGASLQRTADVTGLTRGETALGDVAIRVRTSFGLVSRTLRFPQTDRALVAPSIAGLARFRWMAVHHRVAISGARAARRRGEGSNFSRLRDYVAGDDPRHIDWKATARRGHPITREFTVEQSQTVFVLVDAGRSMTQLSGDYPRFEYALSSTLLLADVALTAGDRVGALVFDDVPRALVPAQRGATALGAIRTALIPLQPTLVEPDYATAFRVLAQRQRKRALVVLMTDVLDSRTARSLLAHITRSGSHHLAVVVALRNETLLTASRTIGERVSDLYESAAAAELVAERQTALQRMRDAGVVVLDVAPTAMAAAIVNQYLELKSRGAL